MVASCVVCLERLIGWHGLNVSPAQWNRRGGGTGSAIRTLAGSRPTYEQVPGRLVRPLEALARSSPSLSSRATSLPVLESLAARANHPDMVYGRARRHHVQSQWPSGSSWGRG